MKNIFKIVICSMFALFICAFINSDVQAATFDENFGVVHDNTCYSYAVDWHNGHGKTLHDLYSGGTKIPYVKVKTVNPSGEDNVYAFFIAYKPFVDKDYYYMSIFYVSKSSFSMESVYREPIYNYDLNGNSVNSYGGYYYIWNPISSYCDTRDNGEDNMGGVVSFTKDMPIETYDIIINGYSSEIKNNYFLDKIIAFMGGDEDDSISESNERGDSNDDGIPDERLGHFKIKHNRMILYNQDEHQHEHNQLTFYNETDTGVNITSSNISAQYKLEGYLTEDNGTTWKNHYVTPIYNASGQDFIHGKSNTQTKLYICQLTPKYLDFCKHIYPMSDREPFNTRKYVGKISIFVRPYQVVEGQIRYGAWTKCYARFNGSHSESGHEDGGYDNDEDSEHDSDDNYAEDENYHDDGEAGVGYDDDSAEDAADQHENDSYNGGNGGNGGNSNVNLDSIKDLVNQIGNVPLLIAKVFSFLPSWCLTLIATAFAMFIFLLLIKLIRG